MGHGGVSLSKLIEKNASLALTGAEYVREKIIALAGIGPNSLYDQVYAIKVRAKSLDSLVKKVKKKRKSKDKKNYQPGDATDVVGVRLLCLYGEDLPNATRSLVNFIRFCQSPEIKLIAGESLDDAIKEIVVYKSTRNARVYDTVHKYCAQLNLSKDPQTGKSKVSLVPHIGDEASYSSIHFVCFGVSHASGTPKIVPIEFQVRTVFEDTWGEIDHGLEYKMEETLNRPLRKELQPIHKSFRGFLKELKGHLEDAGRLAEQVRSGYGYIYRAVGRPKEIEGVFRTKRRFWGHGYEDAIDPLVLNRFKELEACSGLVEEAKKLRTILEGEVKGVERADEIIGLLDIQIDKISSVIPLIDKNGIEDDKNRNLKYFLDMEKAICLIWKSQILGYFYPLYIDEIIGNLSEATNIYFDLENNTRYSTDPVLNFRLGCTMQELGKPEFGDFFLSRSFESMEEHGLLAGTMMQVIIPDYLGYAAWRNRASVLELGIQSRNPSINRDDQRRVVLDALFFALIAKHKLHDSGSWPNLTASHLRYAVSNNIISYAWEVIDLSASADLALRDFEAVIQDVKDAYPDYKVTKFEGIAKPLLERANDSGPANLHDSLMKFYFVTGDGEKCARHKSLTVGIMKQDDINKEDEENVLYWYAQDRIDPSNPINGLANRLRL